MPSKEIHEAENEKIATLSKSPGQLTDQGLPVRPGYGTSGKPIVLRTNYFEILLPRIMSRPVNQYWLTIVDPEAKKKPPKKSSTKEEDELGAGKIRRLITSLLEDKFFQRYQPGLATNYSNRIFTMLKLDMGRKDQMIMDVAYGDESRATAEKPARKFKATISKSPSPPPDTDTESQAVTI